MTDLRVSGKSPSAYVVQTELEMLRAENAKLRNQLETATSETSSDGSAAKGVDEKATLMERTGELYEYKEGVMYGGKRALARQAGAFATRLGNLRESQKKMADAMPNLAAMTRAEFDKVNKKGLKKISALFESMYVSLMLQTVANLLVDVERDSHFEDDPDTLWTLIERLRQGETSVNLFDAISMEGKVFDTVMFERDSNTVRIDGDGPMPHNFSDMAIARVVSPRLIGWFYGGDGSHFRFKVAASGLPDFMEDVRDAYGGHFDDEVRLLSDVEFEAALRAGFFYNTRPGEAAQTDDEGESELHSDNEEDVTAPPSPAPHNTPEKREREEEEEEKEPESEPVPKPKRAKRSESDDDVFGFEAQFVAQPDLGSEPQLELELES